MFSSHGTRTAERFFLRAAVVGMVASAVQFGLVTPTPNAIAAPPAAGSLTITAFRDYDASGAKNGGVPGEPGLGAVKAAAVCVTGAGTDGVVGSGDDVQATVTGVTAADGSLTLAVPGSPCRVEFAPDTTMEAGLKSVLQPGAAGASSVQFVDAGATLSVGFNAPTDYCQATPKLAMTCFTFGNNVTGTYNTTPNIHVFDENTSTISNVADGRATAAQIGSTWGVAYQRSSKTVFAAAYLKGHTGYGPNGPWAIYKVDPATNSSGSLFVDLNTIGGGGSADPHAANDAVGAPADAWAKDYGAMGKVGLYGLGGLAVGDDDATLWTVNLEARTLLKMAIGSGTAPTVPATVTTYAIPTGQCTGADGTSRPFAVTAKDGSIWVGGVCDGVVGAGATPDVAPKAWVLKFNPASGTFGATPALAFDLGYERGCAVYNPPCNSGNSANYGPWRNSYSTLSLDGPNSFRTEIKQQPMLTGISFVDGDIVVALRNRDMLGSRSLDNPADIASQHYNWPAGEILRSCSTDGVAWQVESAAAGTCPGSFARAAGVDTNSGPGGREFYIGDSLTGIHNETSAGGIAQVPGHANLQASLNDPGRSCSGGFGSMSNANGSRAASAELYYDLDCPAGAARMGKANGLGDIEALCDAAPIELGNRLWIDVDGDGIQDPGEPPLVGVAVDLYDSENTEIGTAVTGTDGTYLFGGVSNANLSEGSSIAKASTYSVRVDRPADFATGGPVAGLMLTTADQGSNDLADSDAAPVADPGGSPAGTWPVISTTTGGAGSNNHTLDFGFFPKYAIGNRVFADTNNSGAMDSSETGIDGVAVELYAADSSGAPTGAALRTDTTSGGGFYRFDGLTGGRYVVVLKASNFATGQPLVGKGSSTGGGQEASPDTDGDLNDNGLDTPLAAGSVSPGGIASGVITLGPKVTLLGGEPMLETQVQGSRPSTTADGRENLTVDFGFYPLPVATTTTTTTTTTPASTTTTTVAPTPSIVVGPSIVPASTTTTTLAVPPPAASPTPSTSPVAPGVIPTIPSPASLAPAPPPCGVLSGSVYIDANGNSVRDGAERGVKGGTVAVVSSAGATVTVPTDVFGRYETACLDAGLYSVSVASGASGTPTNGPKVRSVTISASAVSIDFGYAGASVNGINIGQPEAAPDLAYTGTEATALLSLAFAMIGLGLALLRQRRRFLGNSAR